jgi:hypothetical protein
MPTPKHYYTTKHEIDYIRRLGNFNGSKLRRDRLLKKYFLSLENRDNWGKIDKGVIISYLIGELGFANVNIL